MFRTHVPNKAQPLFRTNVPNRSELVPNHVPNIVVPNDVRKQHCHGQIMAILGHPRKSFRGLRPRLTGDTLDE